MSDTPADNAPPTVGNGWQPLPPRALNLFVLANILGFGMIALVAMVPIGLLMPTRSLALTAALIELVALPLFGVWLARKQYRYTRWKLDADGFALRRGNLLRSETRVPASRVQHLDLKHGPLERRYKLATLVVHTAGTRNSAVSVTGLDEADAETLRDRLAHQIDDDDDA
ncbi:PH domain-containing protein [Luteimonas sp. SX5]|uniref:PH domain-containing protein n=1 Tax=Luteimonas galliterrae TaxID=2940486 RepID=A0ABT0MJ96_9GAMM|nr:PH domain-containing protein [Luteimonas galliterrae]MCL1634949.1 PH domain-containing protein [Luteimonas galliterrae]